MKNDISRRIAMDAIFETSSLVLPEPYIKKINTDRFTIREVGDGLLIMPVNSQHNNNLRGLLKGAGYGTDKYFEQKHSDKELEA
jgi:hypothetical protein